MGRSKLKLRDLNLDLFWQKKRSFLSMKFLYRYRKKLVYGRYGKYYFLLLRYLKVVFWFQLKLFKHLKKRYYFWFKQRKYALKRKKIVGKFVYNRIKLCWVRALWKIPMVMGVKKLQVTLVNYLHRYKRHARKLNKVRFYFRKIMGLDHKKYYIPRAFVFDFTRVYVRRKKRYHKKIFDGKVKNKVLSKFNRLYDIHQHKKCKININSNIKSFLLRNVLNICTVIQNANFFDKLYFIKQFLRKGVFLVNGACVSCPEYILSKWDLLAVSEDVRYLVFFRLKLKLGSYLKYRSTNKYQGLHVKQLAWLFKSKKKAKIRMAFWRKRWKTSKFSKKLFLVKKKKKLRLFINFPKFMEVNYKLLTLSIFRNPNFANINIPFSLYIHPNYKRKRKIFQAKKKGNSSVVER